MVYKRRPAPAVKLHTVIQFLLPVGRTHTTLYHLILSFCQQYVGAVSIRSQGELIRQTMLVSYYKISQIK